jgi:cold shock protein
MATGKIKFFNRKKGYGFIVDDESESEIFVHITGVTEKNLQQDDLVTYDIAEDEKGKKAINVKKV